MRVQIRASGTREHKNQPSSSITKKQLLGDLGVHASDFQCRCRHTSILKMVYSDIIPSIYQTTRYDIPEVPKLERSS